MLRFGKYFLLVALCFMPLSVRAEEVVVQDAFSPRQGALKLVTDTINQAHSSIEVAAYTFTSYAVAWALINAERRGVIVRVVLDKKQNSYRSLASFLMHHHVPVRINGRYAVMHDKFMVVDGKTLELGSFNYTQSAEERNAENVLVIRNEPQVIGDYAAQWQKLWSEGATVVASN